jgi:hypothetical protein
MRLARHRGGREDARSMTTDDPSRAWAALSQRLAGLGQDLAAPPFPVGARETAEGYRYLARLTVLGLQWAVEFDDPDTPAFYRHDDDITKWGGPNVDNRYLRARVRGDHAYRIVGNGSSSHGFVISALEGDMQLEEYGVYSEVWHDELVRDDDGNFELVVSAERETSAPNWMPLHPQTGNITIREYFNDWSRETPVEFRIERIGGEGEPAPPVTAEQIARRLDDATRWIDRSLHYWNRYVADARDKCGPNTLQPARSALGGAKDIAYGFGFCDLGDDEAFVIEGEPPDAWFWNYLLYNMGWFESLDIARVSSRNGTQIAVDPDGRFRLVITHRDPGVPNWIDTTGLRETMIAYRYVRTASKPVPTGRVVKLADLDRVLPPSTPRVTPDQRRDEIAIRQRHLAARFRR